MKKASKNSHKTKGSQADNPATFAQRPWQSNPSLWIAILSLLTSTILGILSITNSRNLSLLEKEVYIPKIQVEIGQKEYGLVYFEVLNQGFASANNMTIEIDWADSFILQDCVSSPPFHDIKPIHPIQPNNVSYRVESLPVQSTIRISCSAILNVREFEDIIELANQGLSKIDPTPSQNTATAPEWARLIPPTPKIITFFDGTEKAYYEIPLSLESLSVKVFADNLTDFTELERPLSIWAQFVANQ